MAQAADMSIYCENTTLYRSSGGMSDVAKDVQGGRRKESGHAVMVAFLPPTPISR